MHDYEVGEEIRKGSDSKTIEVTKKGKKFCLKAIFLDTKKKQIRFKKESKILQSAIGHENVIEYEQSFKIEYPKTTCGCLIMELFGEMNLEEYSKKNGKVKIGENEKNGIPENEAREIFLQIVNGLKFLHLKNIVHRDLKCENILIDPKTLKVKIIDFGIAFRAVNGEKLKSLSKICGTPFYMAPEVYRKNYDGKMADIWSIGVLLYRLVSGEYPFDNEKKDLYSLINSIQEDPFVEVDGSFFLNDLLRGMLEKNPKNRYSLEKIEKHPFFIETLQVQEELYSNLKRNSLSLSRILKKRVLDFKENGSSVNLKTI